MDASTSNYSAFVFQVHAEGHNLTLRNTSSDCVVERECATNGECGSQLGVCVCVCVWGGGGGEADTFDFFAENSFYGLCNSELLCECLA